MKEVEKFRQVEISQKCTIRCLPLLDNILMIVLDEGSLQFYDMWSNDWSEPLLEMPLSFQLSNIKLFKISPEMFIIASVTFRLYQVTPLKNNKIKIKLKHEVLAWDFQTHHKFIFISHEYNRTEMIMANQSKEFGIAYIKCLWKSKKI